MPQDDIAKLQAIIKESAVQQDRNAQVVVYRKYFRRNKYVENKVMMKFVYHYGYYYVYICGMQLLQYPRYCNNSGSLTPLPCRVVNHCLVE